MWYLSNLSPLIFDAQDETERVWENLYFPFMHCQLQKGKTYFVEKIFLVRVCTMMSEGVFKESEMVWVTSVLSHCCGPRFRDHSMAHVARNFRIPRKYSAYYTRIGADRSKLSKEDIETAKNNPECTGGRLYKLRLYKHHAGNAATYPHQRFFEDTFFPVQEINEETNDCLPHAVNFALRHPLFTHRQQLVRLMQLRNHQTQEAAMVDKCKYGVPITAFQDFMLLGDSVYSLKPFGAPFNIRTATRGMLVSMRRTFGEYLGHLPGQHQQLVAVG